MSIRIKWLGCAGFEMDFGGFSVVTDPFMDGRWNTETEAEAKIAGPDPGLRASDIEHCDLLCVTHGHYDHVTEIQTVHERFGCPVLCGELTAAPLMRFADLSPMDIRIMNPNLELNFGVLRVKALFGVHTRTVGSYQDMLARTERSSYITVHPDWKELHNIGSLEYRNFLFTAANGEKLLHWGNPLYPELRSIIREANPDILILQINSSKGIATLPEDVFSLLEGTKIRHIVANHIDFPYPAPKKVEIAEKLAEAINAPGSGVRFHLPEYGKWMEF